MAHQDREELAALRRMAELEDKAAKSKVAAMPGWKKFGEGIASTADVIASKGVNLAHDAGRGVLNLMGANIPDLGNDTSMGREFSTEAIRAKEARSAPVRATGPGLAGQVAAESIALAPLYFVGKGMGAAGNAPRLPRAVQATLRNPAAQAAVEGSIAGTVMSDPEARGQGAAVGAGAGVALERLGALGGRVLRGAVKRSAAAKELDRIADLHQSEVQLPLSLAASDEGLFSPFMKFIYGKVLPNVPGAEGALQKQGQRAGQQFREIALKEAAPGGMGSSQPGYAAGLPLTTGKQAGAGSNVRMTMKDIQDAFQREYSQTIKSYAFNAPSPGTLAIRLKTEFPNIDDATLSSVENSFQSILQRYAKNGVIDGDNLIRAKTQLATLGRGAGEDRMGQAYYQAQELLDDVVRQELQVGNKKQNLEDLQRYESLADPWRNFLRVQKAAARSKSPTGEFTPQELTAAVKSMSRDSELARGTAPMQELASLGEQTVGQKAHQPSFLERALTLGSLGGAGVFSGGPAALPAMWFAGRGMASKKTQDALMGQLASQKVAAEFLRRHPELSRATGGTARNVLAGEVVDNEP